MPFNAKPITKSFAEFFQSEQAGAVVLMACTVLAIALANSPLGGAFESFWKTPLGPLSVELWVNDLLMAVFFLLIGLELERELYVGELSKLSNALLPIFAAVGGMAAPALIHYGFNAGLPTQAGFGIPMATDIAFAIGVLALLGSRVPVALKVFVVAFAVIDDLGAIVIIAVFYSKSLSLPFLFGALGVFGVLVFFNRVLRWMALTPYLIGGLVMWALMLKSGVHATLAGVMLAFAIPFSARSEDETSPSHRLEHVLHKPVAFFILPLFALANTGVVIDTAAIQNLGNPNALGIMAGLVLGKPIGVVLLCAIAIGIGVCQMPHGVRWSHFIGAGMLGGIGFTMSIFITNLAFDGNAAAITASKMAILIASMGAGALAYCWLRWGVAGNSKP
jgi:NhaA family Na+:H+ antiporter